MVRRNFGRNLTISPASTCSPRSEQEVLEVLRRHRGRTIRCCGRLHSWSRILDADEVLLDLQHLNSVVPDDVNGQPAAWLGAGAQISRVLARLQEERGWTLPSVGFITEQTVAGAISTGTHGSGRHSLSHYVKRVRIARYAAETEEPVIVEVSDGDELRAARCSLGCLGVILAVQMECRETYCVEEVFHEYAELDDVITAEQESPLQQFYLIPWRWTYFVQHRRESTCSPSRLSKLYQWYRFLVFDIALHLTVLAVVRLIKSNWSVRLLYKRLLPLTVPCGWKTVADANSQLVMEHELFRHLEIEFFVRADRLAETLCFLQQVLIECAGESGVRPHAFRDQLQKAGGERALDSLRGTYCHHYVICVRKILSDDTLISMASPDIELTSQHCYSITLTNYSAQRAQQAFLDLCDFLGPALAQLFSARPHWGKLFPLSAEDARSLYPHFDRFQAQTDAADHAGLFCNPWTEALRNTNGSPAGCMGKEAATPDPDHDE